MLDSDVKRIFELTNLANTI